MLLTNGRIYTLDARDTVVDSLVIARRAAWPLPGAGATINPPAGESIVDLDGRAVLPGLVDGHAHLMMLARSRLSLDLSHAQSEDEIARLVGAARGPRAGGRVADGARLGSDALARTRAFPRSASLDRVAPRHPVALTRVDGHATWANSAALARPPASTRHGGDPAGGRIPRGARRRAHRPARSTPRRTWCGPCNPRPRRSASSRRCARRSRSAWPRVSPASTRWGWISTRIAAYRRLIERGQFPIPPLRGRERREGRGRTIASAGSRRSGTAAWWWRAVKLWLDGALGSRGAALHAPYCDDPGNTGLILVPPEEVERWTLDALACGFQMCVHAIGDRANTLALDAFERALAAAPPAARARPSAARRARPDPRRGRHPALRPARRHPQHAAHALHL